MPLTRYCQDRVTLPVDYESVVARTFREIATARVTDAFDGLFRFLPRAVGGTAAFEQADVVVNRAG